MSQPNPQVHQETLIKIAESVEMLRLTNPMNGDGSNLMLDKVLHVLDSVSGTGLPGRAAASTREQKVVHTEAREIDRRRST